MKPNFLSMCMLHSSQDSDLENEVVPWCSVVAKPAFLWIEPLSSTSFCSTEAFSAGGVFTKPVCFGVLSSVSSLYSLPLQWDTNEATWKFSSASAHRYLNTLGNSSIANVTEISQQDQKFIEQNRRKYAYITHTQEAHIYKNTYILHTHEAYIYI